MLPAVLLCSALLLAPQRPSVATRAGYKRMLIAETSELCTGTTRWWNDSKGFGFLHVDGEPDNEDGELFVHHTHIAKAKRFRSLRNGERVEFKIGMDKRG